MKVQVQKYLVKFKKTIFEKNTSPESQKHEDIKEERLEDLSKNRSKMK